MPTVIITKSILTPIKNETKIDFSPKENCCLAVMPFPKMYKLIAVHAAIHSSASKMVVVVFIGVDG